MILQEDGMPQQDGYRVFLRGLELSALIGVHQHERESAQRLRIDLDLWVQRRSGPLEDRLDQVVDYEKVAVGVRRLVSAQHTNLVETLAERIAEWCLADRRVERVRVRLTKPDALDQVAAVGVEIERQNAPGRPAASR